MSARLQSRPALVTKPWFRAFIALAIGLFAGLIVPQGPAERERLSPSATRLRGWFVAELRGFVERSITEGLGRR